MTATKQLPLVRPRKAGSIRREILAIRRTIKAREKTIRTCLKDVAKNGDVVTVTRTDSNGVGHEKLVSNPWLKLAREAQLDIDKWKRRLGVLEIQFADARHAELDPVATEQEKDEFADL